MVPNVLRLENKIEEKGLRSKEQGAKIKENK